MFPVTKKPLVSGWIQSSKLKSYVYQKDIESLPAKVSIQNSYQGSIDLMIKLNWGFRNEI
jgi:hypothetical protein